MADTSGMAEIRGINVQKAATGFADEALVLKKYITQTKTSAREIRWYKKTAGYLDSTDTTGITTSQIANVAFGARPVVVEQSWTRVTSYVRKYFVESPWITMEDIKDSDPDVWGDNLRDLVISVKNQIEQRILTVLGDTLGTGGNVNTAAATADGWDDTESGNPIADILAGKENIRTYRYNPEGAILYMHPGDHTSLVSYLIEKGQYVPSTADKTIGSGVVMNILGCKVMVSTNMSEDTVIMFVPNKACKWYSFTPLTTAIKTDELIGKKIRVAEEGEAVLVHPRAVHVITDTKA